MPTSTFEPMNLRRLLFGFDGRIGRAAWWRWAVLALLGLGLYFTVILRVMGASPRGAEIAVNLLLLWPTIALSVKRWHDRGKSGWWVLIALMPVIGWLWMLIECGLLRGAAGDNRYGAAPA